MRIDLWEIIHPRAGGEENIMDEKIRKLNLEEADKVSGGSVLAPKPDKKEEKKEPVEPC